VPLPNRVVECLKEARDNSHSDFVVANSEGGPLSYTQFKRVWTYITTRTAKERTYYRYVNGKKIKHVLHPVLGEAAPHNNQVVYSLDFDVHPHQLRHTYITNLISAQIDPKTVQYLAGHKNSKITMDIYAKVKYNQPEMLCDVVNAALKQ
jgi:integrase